VKEVDRCCVGRVHARAQGGQSRRVKPCSVRSYPIDDAGDVLADMPLGGEGPRGREALRFTGSYPDSGRRCELMALPDGCAVDLLGMDR
jgi:hypothetical protein